MNKTPTELLQEIARMADLIKKSSEGKTHYIFLNDLGKKIFDSRGPDIEIDLGKLDIYTEMMIVAEKRIVDKKAGSCNN